ncbi:hypothetical protein ACJQWK_05100 [Exserohilum turcicum]|uniref:Uncharacterized protein n=1 Tax=Exserohilum turcicum (strain 28A) TaxID=671987 RepID=R0K0H1_EXST2|nr:uncharacterized protein SETTUDRAFT_165498 [Exserohilum turcica Et28A]EOA81957.1 hypothetical protein SETTUDRAFT_165498 [Exserohilum turcica Et28A]
MVPKARGPLACASLVNGATGVGVRVDGRPLRSARGRSDGRLSSQKQAQPAVASCSAYPYITTTHYQAHADEPSSPYRLGSKLVWILLALSSIQPNPPPNVQ